MSDGVGFGPRFSILTQQTPAPRRKGGSSAKTEHRQAGQLVQLPSQGSYSAKTLHPFLFRCGDRNNDINNRCRLRLGNNGIVLGTGLQTMSQKLVVPNKKAILFWAPRKPSDENGSTGSGSNGDGIRFRWKPVAVTTPPVARRGRPYELQRATKELMKTDWMEN